MQIQEPAWFKNEQGTGVVIQSISKILKFKMKCVGNGTLRISLRGIDYREKNNERLPIWIEFTDLIVNNNCIFSE